MFEIQQVRELKARKALLISECELDRSLIAAETAAFERKTRWTTLLLTGAKVLLPRLQFLLPVAGWLIARGFSRGGKAAAAAGGKINVVGIIRKGVVAWQLFRKGYQFWSQWREQRALGRLKPLN